MRAASSILLLLCAVGLAAQETAVFRAETSLALVRFHVVKKNAYVDALRAEVCAACPRADLARERLVVEL